MKPTVATPSSVVCLTARRLHYRSLLVWPLLAALGCLLACKPKPPAAAALPVKTDVAQAPHAPAADPSEESAAQDLATQAETLTRARDVNGARKKYDDLITRYPNTRAAGVVYASRAKDAAAAGKTAETVGWYEKLMFYQPTAVDDATREKYAGMLGDVGRTDDAAKTMQPLYQNATAPADKLRLGLRLGQFLEATDQARPALDIYMELLTAPTTPADSRQTLSDRALQNVSANLGFDEAEALWSQIQGKPNWEFLQAPLAFRLAKIYYHTRDYGKSEKTLDLVMSRYPQSPYADQAREFLGHLKSRFEISNKTIGVVLPLSGKYKQYGERSLHAIQMAIGTTTGLKLVVKDTQGEPNIASQAVETLVLEHHVIGIIGPLFSNEAMAAALKAEELSVPLVALSFREGLADVGPFVFRTALTVSSQAKALAKVAFEDLGFHRFALLYPKSRYGLDFISAFWDEVVRRHGEIRGVETYDPDQTTFREPVRRLVGRWFMSARGDYRQAVEDIKAQNYTPLKQRNEMEKLDKSLPPIVDFDALIIPDSGLQIGLIAPALAFEDIVLAHDPKIIERIKKATSRDDIQVVTLMGASTWNNNQTLEHCEIYCEDAVFVDAYFPNSPDAKVRDFVAAFREARGADPNLSEAQAFDTAGLLKAALTTLHPPTTREGLRDALTAMPPYTGITGQFSFDDKGEAQKNLFVLTIKDHTIRLWEKPPEPPRG